MMQPNYPMMQQPSVHQLQGWGPQAGGQVAQVPVPLSDGTHAQMQPHPADHASHSMQQPTKPRRKVMTSLTLQVFIFFGGWWDVFYYIFNISLFMHKGTVLPYPNNNFAMEFCFSWLWILLEIPRLSLVSLGNSAEQLAPLLYSMGLALPILGMYIYFISFQTYVFKLDQFLNAVALGMMGVQLLFSMAAALSLLWSAHVVMGPAKTIAVPGPKPKAA